MNFTILTCTGDRPEAFALCEKYLKRQTLQPTQWVVLDDGDIPTKCTQGQEYFYVPQFKGRGSLVMKIRHLFETVGVQGDALAFFEDDDWYASDWLKACAWGLGTSEIYGEGRAFYYNVSERWWFEHSNMQHASLCATAIRRTVYPTLVEETKKSLTPFIDMALWGKRHLRRSLDDPNIRKVRRTVGIKAMPGRKGYGAGHHGREPKSISDLDLRVLRRWIGEDAKNYEQYLKPVSPNETTFLRDKLIT